ncbi:MAG TPA: dTDP-4-dehydrorhamnose 3,5-epimerase [Puia sp.]|nr:dTDP-4-dehydrorhamnose 3,5-epimerase [Puia sp.]
MIFSPTSLRGNYTIEPDIHSDERGWFARYYCKREFESIGHREEWLQCNHSYTKSSGSIRGLHYQLPPYEEIKLVRCVRGSVFDVVVDLRKNSPTLMQWHGAELSATNRKMMYIPRGFAHGFQTLSEDCELIYHHTEYYEREHEAGIRYNDPRLGIRWPLEPGVISERDRQHALLDQSFKGI